MKSHYPITHEGLTYDCDITWKRRFNLWTQRYNKRWLPWVELSLPHTIHVGVTTYCNLRCPSCPSGLDALARPRQHLSLATFQRVVDDFAGSVFFMLFWDWGEPLLHPQLAEMIGYARTHRIRTVVSTNGSVPKLQERLERLAESRPDVIMVCVDGATQESHEKVRAGGSLQESLNAVRILVRLKEQMKTSEPLIQFRSLATRHNERELVPLLELADDLGADVFSLKTFRPYAFFNDQLDETYAPLSLDLSRYTYEDDIQDARHRILDKRPTTCGKPLYAPTLNSNGRLMFCSYGEGPDTLLGDVSTNTPRAVWRSRESRENRLRFLESGGATPCPKCYFRTDAKSTILATVPLKTWNGSVRPQNPLSKEAYRDWIRRALDYVRPLPPRQR